MIVSVVSLITVSMISVSRMVGLGESILSLGDSDDLERDREEEEVLLTSSDVMLFLSSGLQ